MQANSNGPLKWFHTTPLERTPDTSPLDGDHISGSSGVCEARAGFLNMSWRGSTRRSRIPWTIQKKSSSSRYIHKQGVIMLLDNSFSTQHANGSILLPPSSVLRLPVVRRSIYSGQIILPPLAVRREAASTVLAPLRKIEYCKPFTLLSINHFFFQPISLFILNSSLLKLLEFGATYI